MDDTVVTKPIMHSWLIAVIVQARSFRVKIVRSLTEIQNLGGYDRRAIFHDSCELPTRGKICGLALLAS